VPSADILIARLVVGATLAIALLVIALLFTGQAKKTPWLFLYLLALCIESAVLYADRSFGLPVQQGIWMFTRLVVTALELKLILEIFANWTVSFPGIGKFGRKLLVFLLLIAGAVAASTVSVRVTSGFLAAIQLTIIVNRAANVGFSLFLLLTLIFFRKFGGPVAPNVRRITIGMAGYVTATSATYFVMTGSRQYWIASALLPAVTILTTAYWLVSIKATGNLQPEVTGDPEKWQEAEAINLRMQKMSDAVTLLPRGRRE
jgi:hypothetical protein